ncbi:glycosyltransferase family 1 protein [Microbulbifer sp. ANSA003]|uniref:glycosyltransferase family 1 protein n=1 Tax=Microbulbifer sp. ANSA003 TaxID=3243360 RepID=UPI004041CFC4
MDTEFDLASRWLIVEEGSNPSTDYFILPLLKKLGADWQRFEFNALPDERELSGANIIFVRYVPKKWQLFINRHANDIANIYFFIDDDVFDWRAFSDMPIRYQLKLWRHSWMKQRWLRSVGAKLLVSTHYLQNKYKVWNPKILNAAPACINTKAHTKVFYHGSASHKEDIRWLRPIVEEVLAQDEGLSFEIIGNASVNRCFRNLPRVQVLHPMKWPTYVSILQDQGRAIGLAPLLDRPFNRARSHTKFFDITQSGAVGIYAAGDVYGKVVRHGRNGLLLPMTPSQWIDGILSLAQNKTLRENMLIEARKCL